jgi:hypothetical protein
MRCGPDHAARPLLVGRVSRASMGSDAREVPALFCIVFHCYRRQVCERPARVFPAFCGAFTRSHAFRALLMHCY